MFIRCKGFKESRIETDLTGFIGLLKESGILNKKGEPKEVIKVYLGGAFFKGLIPRTEMSIYRIPAIGYSEKVCVKDGSLGGNIIFNEKEVDPFGWGIGMRVARGVIRAGSVGFMVQRVELSEEGGDESLIFRNQELLEFSVCNCKRKLRNCWV
jgi:hypothetical protein